MLLSLDTHIPYSRRLVVTPGVISLLLGLIILVIGGVLLHYPSLQILGRTIPEIVPGLLIGVGITLVSTGLNEYSRFRSTTIELVKPVLDLEVFPNKTVETMTRKFDAYRVSALIRNKGSVIIRDAKAVIELEDIDTETLKKMLVPKENGNCAVKCPAPVDCGVKRVAKKVDTHEVKDEIKSERTYLVNADSPKIVGELLPWATPEKPVPRPGSADYVHITSISPHQTARLLLFEFIPIDNRFLVRIFSEYGAPGPADPHPRHFRACLIMGDDELKFKVTVAGEGLRKPLQFHLVISKKLLDEVLKYIKENSVSKAVNELQKCVLNH